MKKIFLSFDFYGAGNIGDDLMLDGFLKGIESNEYEFYCYLPRDNAHQKKRFPGINFIDLKSKPEVSISCGIWAGVGDTPIQIKSGEWFLKKLLEDAKLIRNYKIKYFFIGTGAESEAVSHKKEFREALADVDHFWTRDKASSEIISQNFVAGEEKISTSSDLANISLAGMFSGERKVNKPKYDIGICYYDENPEENNLNSIRSFIKSIKKSKRKLLFSNEVSKKGKYEYSFYKNMFTRFERLLYNIEIYHPDYFNISSVRELLRHYSECDVVMSSRYHAILTAAWAGCRIVVLERTSKVSSLAEELCIREIKKPFTQEKIEESFETAQSVSRELLNSLKENAFEGVNAFRNKISN